MEIKPAEASADKAGSGARYRHPVVQAAGRAHGRAAVLAADPYPVARRRAHHARAGRLAGIQHQSGDAGCAAGCARKPRFRTRIVAVAGPPSQGFLALLSVHGPCRRNDRTAGRGLHSPVRSSGIRALHAGAGEIGAALPVIRRCRHGHRHCHRQHLRDPGLRQGVQGPRRRTAPDDAPADRLFRLHGALVACDAGGRDRRCFRLQGVAEDDAAAATPGIATS